MSTAVDLRRGRWALSFADLCLLLLGFFILLQASEKSRTALVEGAGGYFGAKARANHTELIANQLFEPGEALMTPAGLRQIAVIARESSTKGEGVELISLGREPGGNRFDGWDLAAARVGAVARALQQSGIPGEKLIIRGLDEQADKTMKGGQHLILSPVRAANPQ